jgi:hypothetical protein
VRQHKIVARTVKVLILVARRGGSRNLHTGNGSSQAEPLFAEVAYSTCGVWTKNVNVLRDTDIKTFVYTSCVSGNFQSLCFS